jgi:drug/metabolite transporter (DMT)-like permease
VTRRAGRQLALGVGCALAAGLMWGLVFVAPVMLPEYPPLVLSAGRYLAFGLIALAVAATDLSALRRLAPADWSQAARLSLVGNLLYYTFLAAGIQLAGVPLPTVLIGTLPIVIAIAANASEGALPWRRLAPSLAVITLGVLLVNQTELARLGATDETGLARYALGGLLAIGAVACWAWYPIRNAVWLREHPTCSPATWSTAQGLTTLPLSLAGAVAAWAQLRVSTTGSGAQAFDFPLGPQPALFVALMLVLGLCASWLGTLLWNQASRLLPTSLTGQLIVFETLSALLYGFIWRGQTPAPLAVTGIALLVLGVVIGVRAFHLAPQSAASSA